jgi:hypothetical protein
MLVVQFLPYHGSEGSQHQVCFSASVAQTGFRLQTACALFRVQRCAVCIGGSVVPGAPPLTSLLDVSKQLLGDENWIRIWLVFIYIHILIYLVYSYTLCSLELDWLLCLLFAQANSAASTQSSKAKDVTSIEADSSSSKVVIGPVLTAAAAASLADVALRFGTSVNTLLKFNSDLNESRVVEAGQQICVLPCKK